MSMVVDVQPLLVRVAWVAHPGYYYSGTVDDAKCHPVCATPSGHTDPPFYYRGYLVGVWITVVCTLRV